MTEERIEPTKEVENADIVGQDTVADPETVKSQQAVEASKQDDQKIADSSQPKFDDVSLKKIIEALIFASDKPLPIQQIKDILEDVDSRLIRKLINEIRDDYKRNQMSFGITEVAGGFQFSTDPSYGRWLKKLYKIKQSDYLTGPSLETLAIIAYRQPVTRSDMEFIRGVKVDGVVNTLLQKGLIRVTGKRDVVGKPFLYGTTNLFLQYFGLNSLQELPALPEFQEADLRFQQKDGQDKNADKEMPADDVEGEKYEEVKDIAQEDRPDRQ